LLPVASPELKFTMFSDVAVTANFISNPFVASKGTYYGLISQPDIVEPQTSGSFALTLSTNGVFSGVVVLDGNRSSFTGKFDGSGSAVVHRPVDLQLQLDLQKLEIQGVSANAVGPCQIFAARALQSTTSNDYAGNYTLVIPSNLAPSTPQGEGYARITIDTRARALLWGRLADNTPISQSVAVTKNGQWPLYVSLYGRRGSVIGWLRFNSQPATALGGDLFWFKPQTPSGKYYPNGFGVGTRAVGCAFHPPSKGLSSFTNGVCQLSGGNLPVALTNRFAISTDATNNNKLKLKWDSATGFVRGSIIHPVSGKNTLLSGVILQKEGITRGYFLGPTESGSFKVQQQTGP
jgi:hypothetical protein